MRKNKNIFFSSSLTKSEHSVGDCPVSVLKPSTPRATSAHTKKVSISDAVVSSSRRDHAMVSPGSVSHTNSGASTDRVIHR